MFDNLKERVQMANQYGLQSLQKIRNELIFMFVICKDHYLKKYAPISCEEPQMVTLFSINNENNLKIDLNWDR